MTYSMIIKRGTLTIRPDGQIVIDGYHFDCGMYEGTKQALEQGAQRLLDKLKGEIVFSFPSAEEPKP